MIRPYHSFRNNLRIALLSLSLDVLPLAVSFLLVLATLALPFALATFALALACHCVNVQCLVHFGLVPTFGPLPGTPQWLPALSHISSRFGH